MWYAVGSGHSTTCSTQRLQTRTCHSFEHINLHRDRHPVLTGDRGYSLRFSSNLKTKQARYSPRKGGLIQSSTVPHCSGTTQHSLCTTWEKEYRKKRPTFCLGNWYKIQIPQDLFLGIPILRKLNFASGFVGIKNMLILLVGCFFNIANKNEVAKITRETQPA